MVYILWSCVRIRCLLSLPPFEKMHAFLLCASERSKRTRTGGGDKKEANIGDSYATQPDQIGKRERRSFLYSGYFIFPKRYLWRRSDVSFSPISFSISVLYHGVAFLLTVLSLHFQVMKRETPFTFCALLRTYSLLSAVIVGEHGFCLYITR